MQTKTEGKMKFDSNVFIGTELEGLTEDEIIEKYFYYIPITIERKFPSNEKFLEMHGLEKDDLIQFGRIAMMEAIRTYDPTKSKFLTHLINCLHWSISVQARQSSLYNIGSSSFELMELDSLDSEAQNEENDTYTLADKISDGKDHTEDSHYKFLLGSLKSVLPKKALEYIKLRAEGYTFQEIGEMYGVSRQAVEQTIARHREKITQSLDFIF